MHRIFGSIAAIAVLLAAPAIAQQAAPQTPPSEAAAPLSQPGLSRNVMDWTLAQRTIWFRQFDKAQPTVIVRRGDHVHPLPKAAGAFDVRFTVDGAAMNIDSYMTANRVAGLLVLHDGRIMLERYGLGRGEEDRWTAWSVTKSVTSTLIGAAIKDGAIGGVDDELVHYLPELKGSAFDGVTLKDMLLMAAGTGWDEDYEKKGTPFYYMMEQPFLDQMKTLPRVAQPGTVTHYNTGLTNLLGLVVTRATGKPISQYLSEKIWAPYGMEKDASWWTNHGQEVAGANLSMTLRDFGRFGQFILDGGVVGGQSILPDGWIHEATTTTLPTHWPAAPQYGYQWWVRAPGKFMAIGIYGQSIYIEPAKKLVVVLNESWPHADDNPGYAREMALLDAISAHVAP